MGLQKERITAMPSGSEVLDQGNIEELQRAADYIHIKRNTRGIGAFMLVMGLFCAYSAVAIMVGGHLTKTDDTICRIAIAMASFQVMIGLWLVSRPSRLGIRFAILLLAIETIGLWSLAIKEGRLLIPGLLPMLILGLLLILLILWIRTIYRNSWILHNAPRAEDVETVNGLAYRIRNANVIDDPQFIEYRANALVSTSSWRAQLTNGPCMFLNINGHRIGNMHKPRVLFATKDAIEIINNGKRLFRKDYHVDIKINDHTMRGIIPQESLERYESWKNQYERKV